MTLKLPLVVATLAIAVASAAPLPAAAQQVSGRITSVGDTVPVPAGPPAAATAAKAYDLVDRELAAALADIRAARREISGISGELLPAESRNGR